MRHFYCALRKETVYVMNLKKKCMSLFAVSTSDSMCCVKFTVLFFVPLEHRTWNQKADGYCGRRKMF